MARVRTNFLADKHRLFGDLTVKFEPSHSLTALQNYLVRWGVWHLIQQNREREARTKLLNILFFAQMLQTEASSTRAMKVYIKLGTKKCRKQYSRKLQKYKNADPNLLELNALSECARFFGFAGWYECSALAQRISLEKRKKGKKQDLKEIATECNNLAITLRNQGHYEEAINLHKECISICKRKTGKDSEETANALRSYGFSLYSFSMHDQALVQAEKAYSFFMERTGKDSVETAECLELIGLIKSDTNKLEEAIYDLKKAIKIQEKILGTDHPHMATLLNNLGQTYADAGNPKEAKKLLEESLRIRINSLGKDHHFLAYSYNNLAGVLSELGNANESLTLQKKALEIREKALGRKHPEVAMDYDNLGSHYYSLGDIHKDIEFSEKALLIFESAYGPVHSEVAISYMKLSERYNETDQLGKALNSNHKAQRIFRSFKGFDNRSMLAKAKYIEGIILRKKNEFQLAQKSLKEALRIRQKISSGPQKSIANCLRSLGLNCADMHQIANAIKFFSAAIEIYDQLELGSESRELEAKISKIKEEKRIDSQ